MHLVVCKWQASCHITFAYLKCVVEKEKFFFGGLLHFFLTIFRCVSSTIEQFSSVPDMCASKWTLWKSAYQNRVHFFYIFLIHFPFSPSTDSPFFFCWRWCCCYTPTFSLRLSIRGRLFSFFVVSYPVSWIRKKVHSTFSFLNQEKQCLKKL